MAQYQISVDSKKVKDLMIRDDGLKGLVEEVLNQILEAQATEAVGAEKYDCSEQRQGYRNGYRERKNDRQVGTLCLRITQIGLECSARSYSADIRGASRHWYWH